MTKGLVINKRGNAALLIILAAAIVLVLLLAPSAMKQAQKHSQKAIGVSAISRLSFFNMDLTMAPAHESKTVYEFMADSKATPGEFKMISAEKILFPKIVEALYKNNPDGQINLYFTKAYENPNPNKLEYPPLDSAFETWSMGMDMWDRASLFFWKEKEEKGGYHGFPLLWTKTPERYWGKRYVLQTMSAKKIMPEEKFQKYIMSVKNWLSIKSYDKEKLRQMLKSDDSSEKDLALRLIGSLKYRDFNKDLIEFIKTKNRTNTRSRALQVMGIIGDEEFVDPIISFYPDSYNALEPLGKIGNDKAVEWLVNKLKNPKGDGYFQATVRALATTGNPKALEALKKHRETANPSQNDLFHLDAAIHRLESEL